MILGWSRWLGLGAIVGGCIAGGCSGTPAPDVGGSDAADVNRDMAVDQTTPPPDGTPMDNTPPTDNTPPPDTTPMDVPVDAPVDAPVDQVVPVDVPAPSDVVVDGGSTDAMPMTDGGAFPPGVCTL